MWANPKMRWLKTILLAAALALLSACFLLSPPATPLPVHHAQTVRKASPETVKGDFERNNHYEFAGAKAVMWRDGAAFFMQLGATETYQIEAVVGADKLEEYLARQGAQRIHLPLAYDLRRQRWTHLTDTVIEAATAAVFSVKTDWEAHCAACHLEMNQPQFPTACAACHAKPLHASETDALRFSAREERGLSRAVCLVKNKGGNVIHCQSCHAANVKEKPTPQVCINCHQHFATPAAVFEHTQHAPASANCFSCHQPETVYGHLTFQRTHEISIPNPALTITKNLPNACNLCHVDKSVNWAISASQRLWGIYFRDAQVARDAKFNQPETLRALAEGDVFARALAADALSKHADAKLFQPLDRASWPQAQAPLVRYFFSQRLEPTNAYK